jgi:predicted amidohydrolase
MRAHLVQLSIAWHDKAANHERVAALLDKADVSPGDFVLLPEMFDTGFSFDVEATNDKNGRTLEFLLELAEDLGVVVQGGRTVAACHSEQCAARNIMTAVAPSNKVLCEYTKIHPFSLGGEQTRFPGGSDVMVYAHAVGVGGDTFTIQPAICYDLRFPELFRAGLAKGADVIALGACWPAARASHWRALLIARAIENQAYVLGVNRVGADPDTAEKPGLKYAGGSIVVSPRGEVVGELGAEEGVLSVEVDAKEIRRWREVFPAWKDRRI